MARKKPRAGIFRFSSRAMIMEYTMLSTTDMPAYCMVVHREP